MNTLLISKTDTGTNLASGAVRRSPRLTCNPSGNCNNCKLVPFLEANFLCSHAGTELYTKAWSRQSFFSSCVVRCTIGFPLCIRTIARLRTSLRNPQKKPAQFRWRRLRSAYTNPHSFPRQKRLSASVQKRSAGLRASDQGEKEDRARRADGALRRDGAAAPHWRIPAKRSVL